MPYKEGSVVETDQGVFELKGGQWAPYVKADTIMPYKEGSVVETEQGVFELKGGQWVPYVGDIKVVGTALSQPQMQNLTPTQIGQIYESDVPTLGPTGEIIKPETQRPQRGLLDIAKGVGEAGLTAATGLLGGMPGMLYGTGKGILQDIMSGQFGQQTGRPEEEALKYAGEYTYQPRTKAGQEYAQAIGETAQAMQPLMGLTGELSALGQGVKNVIAAKRDNPFVYASPEKQKIAELIQKQSPDIKTAKYKIGKSIITETPKIVKDKTATYAIKQGFDEGVIAAVKGASVEDKNRMLQMTNIMRKVKTNAKYGMTNRPTDVVGQSFVKRLDQIRRVNKSAGSRLDDVAMSLKNKRANYSNATNEFNKSLENMGIKFEDDALQYVGSDIEGLKGPQNAINNIYARLSTVKDAYDLHRLKRYIDEQVSYGKSAEGLAGKTENVLKTLRRNIDQSLDNTFSNYNKVNTRYADTRNAIDMIQDVAGQKMDLTGPNAKSALGTLMRRIMSNTQSRVRLLDSINEIQKISDKYGGKFKDDLMVQMLFADELDSVFKPVARTSFQGQIGQAVERTAKAVRSPGEAAMEAGTAAVERMRGINEENAFKAINQLLRGQ